MDNVKGSSPIFSLQIDDIPITTEVDDIPVIVNKPQALTVNTVEAVDTTMTSPLILDTVEPTFNNVSTPSHEVLSPTTREKRFQAPGDNADDDLDDVDIDDETNANIPFKLLTSLSVCTPLIGSSNDSLKPKDAMIAVLSRGLIIIKHGSHNNCSYSSIITYPCPILFRSSRQTSETSFTL